jgi:hypothetical protein
MHGRDGMGLGLRDYFRAVITALDANQDIGAAEVGKDGYHPCDSSEVRRIALVRWGLLYADCTVHGLLSKADLAT